MIKETGVAYLKSHQPSQNFHFFIAEMDSELDLEDFSKKCTDFQFRSQSHQDKILKILQILQEKLDPQLLDKDLDLVLNCLFSGLLPLKV